MSNDKPTKAETLSFSELMSLVETDGVKAMRIAHRKYQDSAATSRQHRDQDLAICYKCAERWRVDQKRFQRECVANPIWRGRTYELKPKNSLRLACVQRTGSATGPRAETACTEANALSVLFDAKPPVPAEQVCEELMKPGGLGRLLKIYRSQKRRADPNYAAEASPVSETMLSPGDVGDDQSSISDEYKLLDDCEDVDLEETEVREKTADKQPTAVVAKASTVETAKDDVVQGTARSKKYPAGTRGLKSVEFLAREAGFFELMKLGNEEERLLRISVKKNGDSKYKRFEIVSIQVLN